MKAIDCFEAAIELDPELAEAHIAMAYVTMYYGSSWTDAEEHWIRALELDPESSLAHSQFTLFLAAFGREGEVREHGSIASRLDPLEPFVIERLAADHGFGDGERLVVVDHQGAVTENALGGTHGGKVFLELWVKVKSGWAESESQVRQWGYE